MEEKTKLFDKIKILFENEDFLCISKPSGIMVHSAPYMKKNKNERTLVDWLIEKFSQVKIVGDDPVNRPGIVHRLDKETSGLMIIALNQKFFEFMKFLFQNRKVKKTYLAVVKGETKNETGEISAPIGIKKGSTKRTVFSDKMSKQAVTEFKKIFSFEKNNEKFSFLEVYPKTGRTHQIRVHLNHIHHPIIGDSLYGGKHTKNLFDRLLLHAHSIEFVDVNGKILKFTDKLPDDFKNFFPGEVSKNLLNY